MFPLPFRAMMQFEFLAPVIQRVMGSMMSLVMRDEDSKVPKGQVLVEINKVGNYSFLHGGDFSVPTSIIPGQLYVVGPVRASVSRDVRELHPVDRGT